MEVSFFVLFLFHFHSWYEKDIILDLGQCINFAFSSRWIFPEVGCALSKHPVSCQHSATGVVSGESGGGALTQGRWTVACLSPAPSCFIWAASSPVKRNPQPLGVIGYEYPVKSAWWEDVNILLMFRLLICSLTRRIIANGRLPKEWSSSLWEPLTQRGWAGGQRDREDKRGMQRAATSDWVKRRLLYADS